MTDHLSWEALNDLADGLLSPEELDGATAHLRTCPECADALTALRATVAQVAALGGGSIDPPDELWSEVRATIDARKIAALPGGAAAVRGWWVTPRRIVAAAVVLVALSSAATVAVLRTSSPVSGVAGSGGRLGALAPVSWQAAEQGYLANVEQLRDELEARRDGLAPATIVAVERALATIDVAIAEARAALLEDPANVTLSELLASHYRQKVELLRRATQLDAST